MNQRQAGGPRVLDVFTFFNEFDLLEARLRLLSDVVDCFVIVEADHTFSGMPKPFNFPAQSQRFAQYADKIRYFPWKVDLSEWRWRLLRWLRPRRFPWKIEAAQRDTALLPLADFADNDLVIFGDVDEFPDPAVLARHANLLEARSASALACAQHMYYYKLCYREPLQRCGTVLTTVGHMRRTGPENVRRSRNAIGRIDDAGWHFSYFMSPENLRRKIESFSHQEFNLSEFKADDHLERCISEGRDIFNRGLTLEKVGMDVLPSRLVEVFRAYPGFLPQEAA